MEPLTLDDLLPLAEYSGRRREFFASHQRYVDRYRRVRIGPLVTLIFQNRQTVWFQLQEVLRIARLADSQQVQEELDLYNRLLPRQGQLQAALLIDSHEPAGPDDTVMPLGQFRGEDLRLRIGNACHASQLVTCRPEDQCTGTAHWVQFTLDGAGRKRLADLARPAFFEISIESYRHDSPLLGDDVRQSLVDDLELPQRDAHKAAS